MTIAIHHLALAAADPAQAAAFAGAFGFVPASAPALAPDAALLRAPNCYLEIHPAPAQAVPMRRPVNTAGITHYCVQSDSMERLYGAVAAAGATFHSAPLDLGTGNTYCYARDVEWNVVELERLPYAPEGRAPWIAHVAFATPDIAAMAAFYHGLLGGGRFGGAQIGPNLRFDQITGLEQVELIPTWIIGANVTIELWQFLNPPTQPAPQGAPGYDHLCFEVDDLDIELARCLALGARSDAPPAAHDGVRTATVRDPDGNRIELLQLLPERADLSVARLEGSGIVAEVAARRG
jgi:catechol 2,3-dioxygenase-like lactoylglutathione lyase family enzyme